MYLIFLPSIAPCLLYYLLRNIFVDLLLVQLTQINHITTGDLFVREILLPLFVQYLAVDDT